MCRTGLVTVLKSVDSFIRFSKRSYLEQRFLRPKLYAQYCDPPFSPHQSRVVPLRAMAGGSPRSSVPKCSTRGTSRCHRVLHRSPPLVSCILHRIACRDLLPLKEVQECRLIRTSPKSELEYDRSSVETCTEMLKSKMKT